MPSDYKGIPINTSQNTHETVFDMIESHPEKIVADIPSGSGAFIQRLKDEGFKDPLALDIQNILEIEHDNFVQADMTEPFPIPDGSCDTLVCIDGIEHIYRQADFVRETNRILRMNGEFIISTPNISSIRSRWKWFWTGHHYKCESPLDENNPTPLHHIGMISFHELRYMLHRHGFEVTDIRTNRIKAISVLYGVFLPFIYLATWWTYRRRGKRQGTLRMNKSIFRQVFSVPVLFGETLIVKAQKTGPVNNSNDT